MKHYATLALRILVALLVASTALVPAQMHAATNLPPTFTSMPPTTPVIAGQAFSYTPVATDPDGDPIIYSLSQSIDSMSMAPDHTITWTPKYAGSYTAEIRAQDSFGNITSQSITITVVHGDITSIKNTPVAASLTAGQTVTIHVAAFDQFNNQWDVSPLATLSSPADAKGSISALTYTSEKAGSWQVTARVGSFSASTALTVAQGSIQSITSTASQTNATTDESVTFSTNATDSKGNSWDVSGFTNTATTDPKGSIDKNAYHPHTAGSQKVTTSIHTLTTSNDITVSAGTPAFMSVNPSGPISLALHSIKKFTASVTDQYGNPISAPQCIWSLSNNVGTLSQSGTFTATTQGINTIQVAFAGLTAEVPISVEAATATTANVAAKKTPQVKGETVAQEPTTTSTNKPTTGTQQSPTSSCTLPALWIVILILCAYEVILSAYYLLTRRDQDSTWWIFPVLLSIIGIIIWNKYFCSSYVWWPWTLVGLGVVTTVLLERKSHNPPPATSRPKQPPMF